MSMTLSSDFMRLRFRNGESVDLGMKVNGIQWPPPEKLDLLGTHWKLLRRSTLDDDTAAALPLLARGAEYEEVPDAILASD